VSAASLLAVGHGALLQAADVLAEVAPSPSPSSIEIPPEDQTSPGLLGFLVTFAVAAAVIALGFSLFRHLRVVDRNARRRDEAEQAGAGPDDAGHDGPRTDGPGTDGLPPAGAPAPRDGR
jgi:hypothetical protein